MKTNLKTAAKYAAFLVVLALLISLLSQVFAGRMYEDVSKVTNEYRGIYGERENSLDLLLAGDSECYCNVSPMELWEKHGITSYCLSASSKTIQDMYEYLLSVLEYQSPSVVVLETNCLFKELPLEEVIRSQLRIALPVAANHDTWQQISSLSPGEEVPDLLVDDAKGYYYRTVTEPWEGDSYMVPSEEREPLSRLSLWALDRFVQLCRERNIELVLLTMPAPLQATWPRHNTLQDYGEENDIPYLDLNLMTEELGLDWQLHTRDGGDHLNHSGTVLVSDYLGSWLQEHYALPDHRGEPGFAEWEVSLENYRAMVAEDGESWKRVLRDPTPTN